MKMTKLSDKFLKQAIIDGSGRLNPGDAKLLIKACEIAQAETIVEIGSFDGGSTIILGTWAKENDAQLICMEPKPTAKWRANMIKYELCKDELDTDIDLLPSDTISLMIEPSPKSFYFDMVDGIFPLIDVLFIDGDHRPTHTITDFIAGAPFLKVGGVWVQHDWCGRPCKQYGGRSVAKMVQDAVKIILDDYGDCFEEIGRSEGKDRGAIAFKKIKDMRCNIK